LGKEMALLEAKVVLCMLLSKYEFRLVPGQNITYKRAITLHPSDNGIKMTVHRRK
jgi:cytochrome P450